MVILHVAALNNDKAQGPNTNVPQNIIYGNKYEKVALYNCSSVLKLNALPVEYVYNYNEYSSIKELPAPFNKPDIVIFHGIYFFKYIIISRYLLRNKIPYIIVPRCSLTYSAQKKSHLKKVLANILFFNKFVKDANSINYLTENEYIESKSFKIRDYYIVGNGVERKNNNKLHLDPNKFIVTFIGRIEWFHKGLDYLIEAINAGQEEFRKLNFKINLYGPDSKNLGSVKKINEMIKEYNIEDIVTLNEAVFGKAKEKILLETNLFIHTSRLEGQPTSVIEAINYGIPVLVTPGTNLCDIVSKYKLGYTSNFDVDDIKNKLIGAYYDRKNFGIISKNEKKYAAKNFDWDVIIKSNISNYKKVIGE